MLARVLLNRLSTLVHLQNVLSESQCGFRADRGTADMIVDARQLKEKFGNNTKMVFIDLSKAFDSVLVKVARKS